MKKRISDPRLKNSSAHISGGVVVDGWLFVSGQGPLDMTTKAVVPGTIAEETQLTLDNIGVILEQAGCTRDDVVRCTCYLADLRDFSEFDRTYREYFESDVPPARATLQAGLLNGIKVEIDAIARCPSGRGEANDSTPTPVVL